MPERGWKSGLTKWSRKRSIDPGNFWNLFGDAIGSRGHVWFWFGLVWFGYFLVGTVTVEKTQRRQSIQIQLPASENCTPQLHFGRKWIHFHSSICRTVNFPFCSINQAMRCTLLTEISREIFGATKTAGGSFWFARQFSVRVVFDSACWLPDSLSRMRATVMAWSCAIFSAVITFADWVLSMDANQPCLLNPPPSWQIGLVRKEPDMRQRQWYGNVKIVAKFFKNS